MRIENLNYQIVGKNPEGSVVDILVETQDNSYTLRLTTKDFIREFPNEDPGCLVSSLEKFDDDLVNDFLTNVRWAELLPHMIPQT